jgi:quinol-cytochrome oxidoreductase complex cytochrome b subunit
VSLPPDSSPRPRAGLVEWLERRVNLTEIFSFLTHFGVVYTPVDTRQPLREEIRSIAEQRIPAFAVGPRILGLLAAILFGLQAVTGMLLAYYYRPTPETAFESTRTIVRDLPAGWFIHQMHAWGALLLIAVVVLRLLRFYWDGLYRPPREILWISVVGMAWVVLQFDFTGHLLGWEARSYWSTMRGMEVIFALPIVGPILAYLLGGRIVNEDVLIRFYILHLLVLPLFYAAFLYLSFATLRRVGFSPMPEGPGTRTTTFRAHLYTMMIISVIAFGLLVTLATLVPFHFHAKADPYSTPEAVRAPWYMLAPYGLLQGLPLPSWMTGLALVLIAFAVLLMPFWLREERNAVTGRRLRAAGIAALVVWIGLGVFGALLDRK